MAYAVMGDVYLDPTSAGAGGTLLRGLDPARPVRLIPPNRVVEGASGGGDDDRTTMLMPGGRWLLELPVIAGNAGAVRLALRTFSPDGDEGSSKPLGVGGVALVVRPRDTDERYWFTPSARLTSESDVLLSRSRVDFTELDESRVVMVCQRSGEARGLTFGDASVVDAAIEEAGGTAMRTLTKIITTAELVALGAVQAGQISMGAALPANAVPLMITVRNRGTAFTSTDGTISTMTATVVATGQTSGAFDTVTGLMTASQRGQRPANVAAAGSALLPSPNTAWTPFVRLTADRDFDSFEDGDDGIEVIILYQPVVLPV